MGVNFDIAFAAHVQIKQTMAPKRIKHVVEERNACLDVGFARAVQIDLNLDVGLFRRA